MNSRVKLALVAGLVIALLMSACYFNVQALLQNALQWIAGIGMWGPVIFILLYIVACVLLVPASLLTLGAGAVFGLVRGTVICSVAATLGATVAFIVGRHLARDWVARRIEDKPRFKAIDSAVARDGWKMVVLTRLSPLFPFNLLNYFFGITQVSLRDYFLASWLGMLPGTLMYVYIGSVIGDLGNLAQSGRTKTPAEWALYLIGLIATVAVTVYVTRIARKSLEEKITA